MNQSDDIGDSMATIEERIAVIETSVKATYAITEELLRIVKGNGRPGLITSVAILEQIVKQQQQMISESKVDREKNCPFRDNLKWLNVLMKGIYVGGVLVILVSITIKFIG